MVGHCPLLTPSPGRAGSQNGSGVPNRSLPAAHTCLSERRVAGPRGAPSSPALSGRTGGPQVVHGTTAPRHPRPKGPRAGRSSGGGRAPLLGWGRGGRGAGVRRATGASSADAGAGAGSVRGRAARRRRPGGRRLDGRRPEGARGRETDAGPSHSPRGRTSLRCPADAPTLGLRLRPSPQSSRDRRFFIRNYIEELNRKLIFHFVIGFQGAHFREDGVRGTGHLLTIITEDLDWSLSDAYPFVSSHIQKETEKL